MTRYTYNPAGELIREEEYASGNIDVRTRPLRTITYHRDRIGRIRQKDSHLDGGEILSTHYRYDKLNRLIQAHNAHSELRFGYDHNGLVKEQLIHLDEPLSSGISRSQSKDVAAQITEHRYDVLGNRIQTILPTGEVLNRLYYGSGHLHHINLDGATLADIERDALHRPVELTLGKLKPPNLRIIVAEEVVMQPCLFIIMLILQADRLVHLWFQTIFLGQFAPAAIVTAPNNIAFFIGHLARDADLIVVVVQDFSCLIRAIVGGDLCKGFIVSVFGVNVGIGTVFTVFL